MNLLELQTELRERVRAAAREIFKVELTQIASEVPPRIVLGDLAFPVAFEIAKQVKQQTGEKQNPRNVAERLKEALESSESVGRVEVAGAGYLNVFFNRPKFLKEFAKAEALPKLKFANEETRPKRMVEHTSVNPNKSAHIGHVRNSVLGDTFVRILRANGERVEVQNYIDNTGVQVADVVVGFIHIENKNLEQIKKLDEELKTEGKTFDYYCWDLYTRVGQFYKENEAENLKLRAQVLHELESGEGEIYDLADYVATRNVECILATMERLDIRYDLLPRESEILHLHFWQTAFEKMQKLGVIRYETEGKNAGCWVMPFGDYTGTDEHDADKILVRSNGTVTYTGKDIAYQMWKLGLLGLDFNYRIFHIYDDGKQIWVTTKYESDMNPPSFGTGETAYNVIDSRQSYPQEIVKKGVAAISPEKGERASVHLSYEMVALSPAAAEELGFKLSEEDRQRPFIEMSGRKGLGVKADDLINRLEANALKEVEIRQEKLSDEEKLSKEAKIAVARQIAIGALRYFLLKFTRNTIIVFDFAEALAFEGETGPYCQYTATRTNSIFRKLGEEKKSEAERIIQNDSANSEIAEILSGEAGDEIWLLITLAARLEETIAQSANQNEPAFLAKYTFSFAKAFNLFYHHHRIIAEENAVKRAVLIAVADITRRQLTAALQTLGIVVPERM
ncbi:MAG: arginine--tRNA ligase [Acidobacteriota bacterium]|nr:arginine--tRNA ligase [Acidobacteriota bacterium]